VTKAAQVTKRLNCAMSGFMRSTVGARDAEVFGDRAVAVALDKQERHAAHPGVGSRAVLPRLAGRARRARERDVGRVDVEFFPRKRRVLLAAHDRPIGQIGRVEVEHEYRMPVRGGERVDSTW
jgi:hypothetical protein